ncbi:MAG: sugar isomerase [Planctomycetota bacterium]
MSKTCNGIRRRDFLAGIGISVAAGGLAMAPLGAISSRAAEMDYQPVPPVPLRVQPVLAVGLPKRKKQTSWRPWGGFHTEKDIAEEKQRIAAELKKLTSKSEFALEFLPLVTLNTIDQAAKLAKGDHDVLLMYAANSGSKTLQALTDPQKWTIVFVRHKSGPVYLWYEVVHNRYLRKTVDEYGQPGVDYQDVVVDRLDEVLWRLRALFGLKNTLGKRIVAVGGPAGWGVGGRTAPDITRNLWKMDIRTVDYPTLGEMIKKARQDTKLVKRCSHEASQYLKQSGVSLDTDKVFVNNAYVLNEVFKDLMAQADTDAITINHCMVTIMPISETTACLPLSLLNDSGYTAYCESDFVVIPSGILLHHISGKPVFLNDPTYPHDGIVTLAHCTAPRKMDGKHYEPTKILTHFESDYGAAPKVEMKLGQEITVIDPDFASRRWLGFEGEIIDNPFLDICRSQIDVQINANCEKLVAETKGFHWMASYGNYLREIGYALKKVGVDWMDLTKTLKT